MARYEEITQLGITLTRKGAIAWDPLVSTVKHRKQNVLRRSPSRNFVPLRLLVYLPWITYYVIGFSHDLDLVQIQRRTEGVANTSSRGPPHEA